jgi:hypothetical protein
MKKVFAIFGALLLAIPAVAQINSFQGIANAASFAYGSQGQGQALLVGDGGGIVSTNTGDVSNNLGAAASYAILAYSGITNTGATVITNGNIGSYPTTTITGSPTVVAPGTINNVAAATAQTALASAITYYSGQTATLSGLSTLSSEGNGSTAATYLPGVYKGTALTMATGIILDAQGNSNAQFVFYSTSTINLASGQTVALINGAKASNVVFVAGSSITTVATSTMNGNLLAVTSITLGGGTLNGRALANGGAVTISAGTAITVTYASASSYSIILDYGKTSAGPSGPTIYPFGGTVYPPIAIGSGATYEVVVPTAATCGPGPADSYQQCSITATFNYSHGNGDVVRSGDGGLQEAALFEAARGGGLVALDWKFFQENNLTTNAGLTAFLAGYNSISPNVTILNYGGITGALSYSAAAGSPYGSTTHVIY